MTSPVSVGSVSVEVTASTKALAKSLRKDIEDGLKGLNLGKLIRDSTGSKPITVPVQLDPDTESIPAKVRQTRVPKVPVELDPVTAAFQQQVRRDTAALAREVAVKVPVTGDAGRLRAELSAQIAEVQSQLKVTVPTEPGAKAEYEAKLKADLALVAARVKQTVHVDVDVDVDKKGGSLSALGSIGSALKGISDLLPNIGGVSSGLADLGGAAQKAAGSSAQLGGSLAGAATTATGPIGIVIGLVVAAAGTIATLGAAAIAAGPALSLIATALSAVAGAAAAIPGALVGAAASFGTLSLGFKGISEAFNPKVGGGGGGGGQDPAARARQVAAAERGVESARRGITSATRGLVAAQRGLESAQRSYTDSLTGVTAAEKRYLAAQQAVSAARVEAKDSIEDLGRALRGAQLDEESAALAVTDALRDLNDAKLTGNIPDIQKADLAYRQAQLTLENTKDAASDLGKEQAAANKKGIEGSDKVVNALQDQADAQDGVKDAQQAVLDAQDGILSAQDALASANDGLKSSYDSLASAQDSLASAQQKMATGAGAVGAKVIPLAPAARRFVDALKALKPAFENLRLGVQQRLFADLDKTVTNLGNAWIPALRDTLGSYADTFNGFFKNLGAGLTQPQFITDLQSAAEGARSGLAKIGDAITTSLVPAFGALAAAAGPFLDKLGTELAGVVTQFSNWVLKARDSGALKTFFDKAATALHDIFDTGKLVTGIIGSLFEIITGQKDKSSGKTALQSFNDGLRRISDWLDDPQNEQAVRDFLKDIKDGLDKIGSALGAADGFITRLKGIKKALFGPDDNTKATDVGTEVGKALIAGIVSGMAGAVVSQGGIIKSLFLGAGSLTAHINEWLGIASPSTVMMETGKNLILGIVEGLKDNFGTLLTTAKEIPKKILAGVGNVTSTLYGKGRDFVSGAISGVGAKFTDLKNKAGQLRTQVFNALSDAGSTLYGRGQQFITGLINGLTSYFRTLGTYAGYAKVYIQNALSKAGSYLYEHGRAVIVGLINGIGSKLNALGSFLNDIGSFIQAHKGPIEKDRVLLLGAGKAIMGGLITGIGDKKAALAAELSDVSSLIGDTRMPELGSDLGSVSASLAVSKQAQIQVGWAPGSTGDPLLDGLKTSIKFRFNGDPMAALAS